MLPKHTHTLTKLSLLLLFAFLLPFILSLSQLPSHVAVVVVGWLVDVVVVIVDIAAASAAYTIDIQNE